MTGHSIQTKPSQSYKKCVAFDENWTVFSLISPERSPAAEKLKHYFSNQ